MAFTAITQTGVSAVNNVGGTNTISVSLGSNPTSGNIVLVGTQFFDGTTTAPTWSIADQNSNAYTVDSTNSGATNMSTAGWIGVGYLLTAPANAHKTITVTFNKNFSVASIFVLEVTVSGGTATVHSAAAFASGTGTISSPTVTASSGDLLWAMVADADDAVASNSPWTNVATFQLGGGAAYKLSATGNTAVAYTGTGGAAYNALGMSFSVSAGGGTTFTSSLTGAASFVGSINKTTQMPLSAGLTFTGGISRICKKAANAALTFVGNLNKKTFRSLSGSLSFVGGLTKLIQKLAMTAALTFSGAMTTASVHLKALAASLSFSGAFSKQTNKSLTGSLTFVGGISRLIQHGLSSALTFTGNMFKTTKKGLFSGSLGFSGFLNAVKGHFTNVRVRRPIMRRGGSRGPEEF